MKTKYEYRTETINIFNMYPKISTADYLNKFGEDGWQLVHLHLTEMQITDKTAQMLMHTVFMRMRG